MITGAIKEAEDITGTIIKDIAGAVRIITGTEIETMIGTARKVVWKRLNRSDCI